MKFAKRIIPLVYFLVVSLPHHPFSSFLDTHILFPRGHVLMQRGADIGTMVLIIFVLLMAWRVVRIHASDSLRYLAVWLFFLVLMFLSDHYLIVNNIERIHYPQYAALALLLGLSLRDEMLIFFVTSFAGFVDEFLQFVMDPMKTNYLDFNDIVLNILGAAAGVVLLMGLRKPALENANRREREEDTKQEIGSELGTCKNPLRSWRSSRLSFLTGPLCSSQYESVFGDVFRISMAIAGFVVLVAGLFGRIVMLVEQAKDRSVCAVVDGKLSFIMSFERHDAFWMKSYYGKVFHVMSPGEGIAAMAVLILATWCAVAWLKGKRNECTL